MFKILTLQKTVTPDLFLSKSKEELRAELAMFLREVARQEKTILSSVTETHSALVYAEQIGEASLTRCIESLVYSAKDPNVQLIDAFLKFRNKPRISPKTNAQEREDNEQAFILREQAFKIFSECDSWQKTGITKENAGDAYEDLLETFKSTRKNIAAASLFIFFDLGKNDLIKKEIIANPDLINMINIQEETLLFLAIHLGNIDLTQFLLEQGATLLLSREPFISITAQSIENEPGLMTVFIDHFQEKKDIDTLMFLLETMIQSNIDSELEQIILALKSVCEAQNQELESLYILGIPPTQQAIFYQNSHALQLLFDHGFPLADALTKDLRLTEYQSLCTKHREHSAESIAERNKKYSTPILLAFYSSLYYKGCPEQGEAMLYTLLTRLKKCPPENITTELCRQSVSGKTIFTFTQEVYDGLTIKDTENSQTSSLEKKSYLLQTFTKILSILPEAPTADFLRENGITSPEILKYQKG